MPKTKEKTEALLTDEQKVNKTYGIAIQRLKDKHLDEFNEIRKAAAVELGVTWTPQPTKEQRAEEEIRKLVEAHPGLAKKYGALLNAGKDPEVDEPEEEDSEEEAEENVSA